jgi:tetratricopeptide (TPR) repeat protein
LPGAEREFQRSIELNPSYASAHLWYDLVLISTGRVEEAMTQSKRALELDPVSTVSNWNAGFIFYLARRYDQAIDQERKTLELDPNFLPAHGLLGEIYAQKSMYKEAVTEFEKGLAVSSGDGYALGGLGYAHAKAGRKDEAQKLLNQLKELSTQKYVPAYSISEIYVGLGEKENAFEWLEKAYEERSARLGVSIKCDPLFDPLRSDPRFADLLRRMNLQQ